MSSSTHPVTTSGLLVETSKGSLVVDLFGADCPALTGNFANLARAGFWTGAMITEVIPNVAVFFSIPTASCASSTAEREEKEGDGERNRAANHGTWEEKSKDGGVGYGEILQKVLLARGSSSPSSFSFWSLVPRLSDGEAMMASMEATLASRIKNELTVCKRRGCTGIAKNAKGIYEAQVRGGAEASPCVVDRAGLFLVDMASSSSFSRSTRFGITLSAQRLDFLDAQYIAIGQVREGTGLLESWRRMPVRHRDHRHQPSDLQRTDDAEGRGAEEAWVAGRPAASWPRPLRLCRVKQIHVLPTAGTEAFLDDGNGGVEQDTSSLWSVLQSDRTAGERASLGAALAESGCFEYWASRRAVAAARQTLLQVAEEEARCLAYQPPTRPPQEAHTACTASVQTKVEPFIIRNAAHTQLECNPHFAGIFLSSDDEDDDHDVHGKNHSSRLTTKEKEERRRAAMQQHQEKANETLSLMLNILSGVADVEGNIKPPENVLFVCKLNAVTTSEGLALCFAQFGGVVSAEVIYDKKTQQSLGYGFVEFESVEACHRAFKKMDQALVDDSRIHVDFSQSVSKLWAQRQQELRKRGRT